MDSLVSTEMIKRLNDLLRTTFAYGRVMMTAGIQALGEETIAKVLTAVREFNTFTEDNDPHGEHDSGSVEVGGQKVFWKVDYYAPGLQHGSEDPADAAKTVRVLTIMLSEEY